MSEDRSLANRQPGSPPIIATIERLGPQIKAALPRLGLPTDRMSRMVLTCLRKTPKLYECEQMSVVSAVVQVAQLGLEPSTPLGHCWLIPYGRECQLVIGYKGFIQLADRAGLTIGAAVVYERDHWVHPRPGDIRIDHIPYDGDDGLRGERRFAYAYATRADRPIQFVVINRRDIERAMASSAAVKNKRKDSPWFGDDRGVPDDTDAMWRKTAVRRLAPFLPMSTEYATAFARAVELDEQAERGLAQSFDFTPVETDPAARTDDLANRIAAAGASEEKGGGA